MQAFYTFASSLGHLTNLQVLNLAEYCLPGGFGELPESIAQLQALRHISIWYQGADAPSRRLFDWPKLLQAIGKVRGLEDLLLQVRIVSRCHLLCFVFENLLDWSRTQGRKSLDYTKSCICTVIPQTHT